MREIRELLKKNIIASWQRKSALGVKRFIKFIANDEIYSISRTPILAGIQVYCLFSSSKFISFTDSKETILDAIKSLL